MLSTKYKKSQDIEEWDGNTAKRIVERIKTIVKL